VVDRVLRGDHQERRRELIGRAVDGHARLGHRLQQRGLGAGRGAVDLVGQQNLREHRSRAKLELRRLLVEHRRAGHIGRQQVGRALNSLERATHAAGQRSGEHGLGDARHIFQQDVSFGEPTHQRENELLPFADDRPLDVGDDAFGDAVTSITSTWSRMRGPVE